VIRRKGSDKDKHTCSCNKGIDAPTCLAPYFGSGTIEVGVKVTFVLKDSSRNRVVKRFQSFYLELIREISSLLHGGDFFNRLYIIEFYMLRRSRNKNRFRG